MKNLERLKAAFKQASLPLSHFQQPSGARVHPASTQLNTIHTSAIKLAFYGISQLTVWSTHAVGIIIVENDKKWSSEKIKLCIFNPLWRYIKFGDIMAGHANLDHFVL